MIAYQVESYISCQEELMGLYPYHYEELSVTKNFPLEPDHSMYVKLNDLGILHIVTCRDDGVLVGYIFAMVTPNLHYMSCKMACEDIYFLKKEYRRGRIGIDLFKFFEKEMVKLGVNRISVTTKVHLDNGVLFEYLGYSFIEKTFSKVI